jgi:hypothetical protein
MSTTAPGIRSRSNSAYPVLGARPPAAVSKARPVAEFPSMTRRRGADITIPSAANSAVHFLYVWQFTAKLRSWPIRSGLGQPKRNPAELPTSLRVN